MPTANTLDRDDDDTAALARRRRAGDRVITNGVVGYYDGRSLLIVPCDEAETATASDPLPRRASRARVPVSLTQRRMCMVTQKVSTWDLLQNHPVAGTLDAEARLALVCEYLDLVDELEGMSLTDFVTAYFTAEAVAPDAEAAAPDRNGEADADDGDGSKGDPRPTTMVGLRVVYRFPGRNVLSDATGVTRDSGGTVAFTDVDEEVWSNIARDKVYPIDPANYRELHITKREAKEINGWLAGTPAKDQPENGLLRSLFVEFPESPEFTERIAFAIVNGKKPYVDRFVQLPDNGFEDDQKPTTRLFGEHCFRVRSVDYVVKVVSP
jgi:hypothetical protein